jgi:methanogenic corrinoid protein MtbC1
MNYEDDLAPLRQSMIDGDADLARAETNKALEAGMDPLLIIQNGGTKAMEIVGQQFQDGESFLPELILGARAMQASLDILLPHLQSRDSDKYQIGKVVMGSIVGDMHDIGINIVQAMLSVNGLEVINLGVDVSVKRFVTEAQEKGAQIIGCSSLLTTSMPYQRQLIQYAIDTGIRDQFFFIVGGGSVTPEWARKIGADGWARTAVGAPELCRKLISDGIKPPLSEPLLIDK